MTDELDTAAASAGVLGWGAVDVPLLVALPVLLVLSGFFSGSETALFGLSEQERIGLRRGGGIVGRAIEVLLADQRMLLITLMLGNMTVNVLYFVISSVLMMRSSVGPLVEALLALGFLMLIVLFGEVTPKMLGNSRRTTFASLTAPVLLTIHSVIFPLRVALNRFVVEPLSRLTAPAAAPPRLTADELKALLKISSEQKVIDRDEQKILSDVLDLSRLKVRDVMTPRVRMEGLTVGARRREVIEAAEASRLTKLPVYQDDLDHIVGVLHVKRFLLSGAADLSAGAAAITRAHFVPEMARLDQLLDHFRHNHIQSAIVVDEYGGTEGIISLEDVIERLVGDIMLEDEAVPHPPRLVGLNRWQVDGDYSVHDWAQAFGMKLISPRVSTLGGLITERLGHGPHPGDLVDLGNVTIEVEAVEGARVVTAVVTLRADDEVPASMREGRP